MQCIFRQFQKKQKLFANLYAYCVTQTHGQTQTQIQNLIVRTKSVNFVEFKHGVGTEKFLWNRWFFLQTFEHSNLSSLRNRKNLKV